MDEQCHETFLPMPLTRKVMAIQMLDDFEEATGMHIVVTEGAIAARVYDPGHVAALYHYVHSQAKEAKKG